MKRTMNSALIVTMFLICATTFAQQRGYGNRNGGGRQMRQAPSAKEILSRLDTNGDDRIDKGEAAMAERGKLSEIFDSLDTNKDGYLDVDELEAMRSGRRGEKKGEPKLSPKKIFKVADNNEDGYLDELEVAAKDDKIKLNKHFGTIDTNKDRLIDMEELKVFLEQNEDKHKRKKGE